MKIPSSELILNADGSIYHLNLKPGNIADTIITVGDQDRVEQVTAFFDEIIFSTQKREFKTQTGYYKGKKLTVISTGIGIDNIDIVMNELDALVNIDFEKRAVKDELTSLNIIRLGTSGGIQPEVPLDHFVMGKAAIGFDGLLHYYQHENVLNIEATDQLTDHLRLSPRKPQVYVVNASEKLCSLFEGQSGVYSGYTGTNIGFYGPQNRSLRIPLRDTNFIDQLVKFEYKAYKASNLEMETSAIYAMAKLLGHHAVSMNAIIANRSTKAFSKDPKATIQRLIKFVLEQLVRQ